MLIFVWNSDIAVNNIQRLIDGLDLDLFTEVIDWDEMKDLVNAFFKYVPVQILLRIMPFLPPCINLPASME